VRLQTMIGNKIHHLIDRQEEVREQAQSFTDLFGAKGMQFLRSTPLPLLERKLLDGQLELLEELRTRISLAVSCIFFPSCFKIKNITMNGILSMR